MDIKLNAKLSAYAKIPSPKACTTDTVTKEEIDTLFDKESVTPTVVLESSACNECVVTEADIAALFRR